MYIIEIRLTIDSYYCGEHAPFKFALIANHSIMLGVKLEI